MTIEIPDALAARLQPILDSQKITLADFAVAAIRLRVEAEYHPEPLIMESGLDLVSDYLDEAARGERRWEVPIFAEEGA